MVNVLGAIFTAWWLENLANSVSLLNEYLLTRAPVLVNLKYKTRDRISDEHIIDDKFLNILLEIAFLLCGASDHSANGRVNDGA